jgi:uncharacterized protein DUF5670
VYREGMSLEQEERTNPPPRFEGHLGKEKGMLLTIAVILGILWLLGMVSGYTMGGFIPLLLALAIIAVLIRVIQGRRVLSQ